MSEDQDQAPLPGPGPSLDRLVAAKMGYEWLGFTGAYGEDIGRWVKSGTKESAYDGMWRHETGRAQPQYSTSWEAAGELIEHIRQTVSKYVWIDSYDDYFNVQIRSVKDGHYILGRAVANTAPHAIVLAFLALPDFEVQE